MTIDSIIAEAFPPATAQPQADAAKPVDVKEAETTEAAKEEPVEESGESTQPPKSEEVAFPKKAVNAISYRDKKIGRLQAERDHMRQELEQLRQKPASAETKADGEPKEADYEGKPYGEYLKAVARYEAAQHFKENKAKEIEQRTQSEAQEWEAERSAVIDENHAAAQKAFPDFKDVMDEAADDKGMIPLSQNLRRAILESDNGAYALYALIKEGLLDQANQMSLPKAAMTVARMEDRGLALSKVKKVTKAPEPMAPAKGAASATRSLDQMSGKELLKWVKS